MPAGQNWLKNWASPYTGKIDRAKISGQRKSLPVKEGFKVSYQGQMISVIPYAGVKSIAPERSKKNRPSRKGKVYDKSGSLPDIRGSRVKWIRPFENQQSECSLRKELSSFIR